MVGESPGRVRAERSRATPHPGALFPLYTHRAQVLFWARGGHITLLPFSLAHARPCRVVEGRGTLSAF